LIYHEVQYGQTLWAIAIEYGVKIDEIRALNNLGSTIEIYQGNRLLIRKDASPGLAAATVENTQTPTESVQTATAATATIFLSSQLPPTTTPTIPVANPQNNSVVGITVGIVLAALLFAGMFTWISSRRTA